MKQLNIKITFRDLFSRALLIKEVTGSESTFHKMEKGIGQVVHRFEDNIHWEWEVIKVERI